MTEEVVSLRFYFLWRRFDDDGGDGRKMSPLYFLRWKRVIHDTIEPSQNRAKFVVDVYDKETTVIKVGSCGQTWISLGCVSRFMQSSMSLMPRLSGLVETSFMQCVEALMQTASLTGGTYLLDANLMEVPLGWIKSHTNILVLQVHREYQPWHHNFGLQKRSLLF